MDPIRDSRGRASLEWVMLVAVPLAALSSLVLVRDGVHMRLDGRGELAAADASASARSPAAAVQHAPAYTNPPTANDGAAPNAHVDGNASNDASGGAVAFAIELVSSIVEGFVDSAIHSIPDTLEAIELAGALVAHEAEAVSSRGVVDYATSRGRVVSDIAGALLEDPERTAEIALALGGAVVTTAATLPALVASGASAKTIGYGLGAALFEIESNGLTATKRLARLARVGKLTSVTSHGKRAARFAGIPFLIGMRSKAAKQWPNVFEASGRVKLPTTHTALLWRLAGSGKADEVLSHLDKESAHLTELRTLPSGKLAPFTPVDVEAVDELVQREYGLLHRDRLFAHDPRQFWRATFGQRPDLQPGLFPASSIEDLMYWTGRGEWMLVPARSPADPGTSLLELAEGRELIERVERAQDLESRVAIAVASPAGNLQGARAMFTEFQQYTYLIREAAAELDELAKHGPIADAVVHRAADAAIDADLLRLARNQDLLRVITLQGDSWIVQHRTGADAFAERFGGLAQEQRRVHGETFLEDLDETNENIWIYARHVRGQDANVDVAKTFQAWRGADGTVRVLEDGMDPPRGVIVPARPIVLTTLLDDADSVVHFLRLFDG